MSGQTLSRHPLSRVPVSREELRSKLQTYSREPFLNILEDMIGAQPTRTELNKWAAKSPDRWAHAIEIFAKLGGFTEKREVAHSFILNMMNMGDAEIQQALSELELEEKGISVPYKEVSALPGPAKPVSAQKVSVDWAVIWERPLGRPRTKKREA